MCGRHYNIFMYDSSRWRRWHSPNTTTWSRHSRRIEPISRSAYFAMETVETSADSECPLIELVGRKRHHRLHRVRASDSGEAAPNRRLPRTGLQSIPRSDALLLRTIRPVASARRGSPRGALSHFSSALPSSETALTKVSPMRRRTSASWVPEKSPLRKRNRRLPTCLNGNPSCLGRSVAIGAAVAGAFRTSDLENEWIGDLSDDVKADLNTRAEAVSQSLREASDTLKAELGDTGAEAIDRVKQAGTDAADAAREKVRSP